MSDQQWDEALERRLGPEADAYDILSQLEESVPVLSLAGTAGSSGQAYDEALDDAA
jgi:hypothetical protein